MAAKAMLDFLRYSLGAAARQLACAVCHITQKASCALRLAGPCELINDGDKFREGQLDSFTIDQLPDVGPIEQVNNWLAQCRSRYVCRSISNNDGEGVGLGAEECCSSCVLSAEHSVGDAVAAGCISASDAVCRWWSMQGRVILSRDVRCHLRHVHSCGAAEARGCPLVHLQVDIGHDGQDERDRWHLEWVRVTNLTTGETATFNCNRWGCMWIVSWTAYTCTSLAAAPTTALPPCLAAFPEAAGVALQGALSEAIRLPAHGARPGPADA